MRKRVLIAGCGYVGRRLGLVLRESGAEVWVLRRSTAALKELDFLGLRPLAADLLNPVSLQDIPEVDHVVFCQAPNGPEDSYEKTYYEGTRNLLRALKKEPLEKIVLVSSTGVYSGGKGGWVDEATAVGGNGGADFADKNQWLLETEKLVLATEFPGTVLRCGGIYGPGRNRLRPLIKEGRMRAHVSDLYVNRIHVEDVVRSLCLLLEKGEPGQVYLGVDDLPSTQKEFYGWLKKQLPKETPWELTEKAPLRASNKRCRNKKLKRLGWKPKYPSYQEGYRQLIREELR